MMVKITIIGSTRYTPYEILAVPSKLSGKDHDENANWAFENKFKKAMDESDLIIVYIPDGIGEHTSRDYEYAKTTKARIVVIPNEERFWSWLLLSAQGESVYWNDATLVEWLEYKKREYKNLFLKQNTNKSQDKHS